jgi:type I restriction enzyme R subunit
MSHISLNELEQYLWGAANILRGPVDKADFKLFEECKIERTPVIVKQTVEDIDSVVKVTRFEGWQWTTAGEREIQKALRRTLLKYQLHKEKELFEKAYAYIREHY